MARSLKTLVYNKYNSLKLSVRTCCDQNYFILGQFNFLTNALGKQTLNSRDKKYVLKDGRSNL